jgi:hypothetical protein
MMQQNKTITWSAHEFIYHKKTLWWHLAFIILATGLIGYAVYTKSILTVITFALIAIVGWFFANRQPRIIRYELNSQGLVFNQQILPYKNIKKFWIIYSPGQIKTLNFETTAVLHRMHSLELGSADPMMIKIFLQQYISEDLDREESLTDVITRKAKF